MPSPRFCTSCGRDLSIAPPSAGSCPTCTSGAETVHLPTLPDPQAASAPPTPASPPPVSLPGYEVLEELGRGGMGVVYKARQTKVNRLVAIKMILAGQHAGEAELTRFRREAEAIGAMQHANIVQVYEVNEHEGRPYFSLEYCGGGSLEKTLNATPMEPHRAAALLELLARAVHAAHESSVIHRDLKPANVLFTGDGTPKITDFGLAKKLNELAGADRANQTHTGTVMGTPSYMSPEQAQGRKDVGPAADVYALGAVLYECLTGRPPFRAATPLETVLQVLRLEPVPPSRLQPRVSRDLETICLKCLQKAPAARYASADDLADDLRRFLDGEPIRARPVGPLLRAWRWCRREPVIAALSAAVALLLVASLVNLRASLASVETLARRNQGLLAESLAGRLDERLQSNLQAVKLLSRLPAVRALLAAPPARRPALLKPAQGVLADVRDSNPDFSAAFVLDPDGLGVASTNPAHPGRSYAFRDYFQQARRGSPFRSQVLIGTSTGQAGLYYSAPVLGDHGALLGVVVIKLEATAVWRIVEGVAVGEGAAVFVVDEDGVVVAHSDRALLFHSVAPVDERLARARFGSREVQALGPPGLSELAGAAASGHLEYATDEGERVIAYAPLREKKWVLAVDMSARQLAGPAHLRLWRTSLTVALAAAVVALLALPLARRLRRSWRHGPPGDETRGRVD